MSKQRKDSGAPEAKKSKRPKDPGMFWRGVQQTVKGRKVISRFCMLCHGKKIVIHCPLGN